MAMACFEGSIAAATPSASAVVERVGKKDGKNGITGTRCPVKTPLIAPTTPPATTATTMATGQGNLSVSRSAVNVLDNPTTPTTDRSTSAQIKHMVIAALTTIRAQLTLIIPKSVLGDTNWLFAIRNANTRTTG